MLDYNQFGSSIADVSDKDLPSQNFRGFEGGPIQEGAGHTAAKRRPPVLLTEAIQGRASARFDARYRPCWFTLYKENKDTVDATNLTGRMLEVKANSFGFAGTKDRRSTVVQRTSIFRARHQI